MRTSSKSIDTVFSYCAFKYRSHVPNILQFSLLRVGRQRVDIVALKDILLKSLTNYQASKTVPNEHTQRPAQADKSIVLASQHCEPSHVASPVESPSGWRCERSRGSQMEESPPRRRSERTTSRRVLSKKPTHIFKWSIMSFNHISRRHHK